MAFAIPFSTPDLLAEEAVNYNQVGKEVKGRSLTFYQVLIDIRDCPHVVSSFGIVFCMHSHRWSMNENKSREYFWKQIIS